jgi:hypothetical protein
MSAYSGQLQVVNLTGGDISDVLIGHNGESLGPLGTVANGAMAAPISFQSESGVDDDWSVSFIASGTTYSCENQECNYEEEDQGETLLIIF